MKSASCPDPESMGKVRSDGSRKDSESDQPVQPALKKTHKINRRWKYERDAAKRQRPAKRKPVARTGSCGGPLHIELVGRLKLQGAGTKNFPAAMRAIGVRCSLRPDAWFTRLERRHLDVYEVTVGNAIDSNKRENFRAFTKALAAVGWTLTIWRVTKRGETKEFTP